MNFKKISSLCIASILGLCLFTVRSIGGTNSIDSKVLNAHKNKKDYKAPKSKTNNFVRARVVKVVDGDTISVSISGKVHKIRMVGVDTPETVHPKKPVQYYGKEASNYTKSKLTGKTVYLQKDVRDTDKYGRLLRYVWIQRPSSNNPSKNEVISMMYNAQLVKNGYGHVYTYPPDVKYIPIFRELESLARKNNIGLWKKSNTNPKPIEKPKTTAKPKTTVKPKTTAKPNLSSKPKNTQVKTQGKGPVRANKRTNIYHMPGDRYYDKISPKNIIYFRSPQEAESAGYKHSKV